MKHWKILGAAMTISALAFAATASATTLTGSGGETTPTIHAVNEGSHISLHNNIVNIECQSTFEGTVSSHGSGVTAGGFLSTLTFNNCTNEWVVDVVFKGSFEVHRTTAGFGHGSGELVWTSGTITATRAGLSCHYVTHLTRIGNIGGGSQATVTISISANLPRHGGSFLCGGSTALLTGSYVTTGTLAIDP